MINRKLLMAGFAAAALALGAAGAMAQIELHNTVTGEPLNLSDAGEEGQDTPAFKEFIQTGKNPYNKEPNCLANGEQLFLSMCSGCHGHVAEGKIGPGLNDDYWTYPDNNTDKGLFETIFGGASGQMGPMYGAVNPDQMLQIMAWVRHLYKDGVENAVWLDDEQKASFKPYDGHSHAPKADPAKTPEACKASE
ncbi:cytochrome c(L), periplasmic [Methylopila musalis]|uniref:Cytochrome c-L n=1 Tax=Methylopila musalis TaxID=1134781 RepID=A0ABW3ZAF4_9HYPH